MNEKAENEEIEIEKIFEGWDAPFITRAELCKRLKGIYKPHTLAVMDCSGKGIPGGRRIMESNGRYIYPVKNVIKWLKQKGF